MSRLLPLFAVALALAVTGCSDGDPGRGVASPSEVDAPTKPGVEPEAEKKFTDFPGPELVYQSMSEPAGTRIKPIEAEWASEIGGNAAKGGEQFLKVYVAATGEDADRAMDNVHLADLKVRFRPSAGQCASLTLSIDNKPHCYHELLFAGDFAKLDGDWRDHEWHQARRVGTDFDTGATMVGGAAFSIPESMASAAFELCAPTPDTWGTYGKYPCIPLKAPKIG